MTEPEPPKIEFPCDNYPVKIMGEAHMVMRDFVLETTEVHAPNFDRDKVTIKASSGGRWQSITVYITATGVQQLQDYHQALIAHPAVKMVL